VPKLSLCLIARNEEDDLPRCLESVRQVADEIVVVDTGSTDNTVNIALSFDAKVVEVPWQDDFSIPRNRALEEASGDWILVLDADEALNDESRRHIREAVTSDVDALNIIIRNHLSDDSLFEPRSNRFVRLFRHRPEFRFEGRVHEQILPSIQRSGGQVQECDDIVIDHFGYADNDAGKEERRQRNLRLLDIEVETNPEDGFVRYHMGATLQSMGKVNEAVEAFQAALDFGSTNGSLPTDLQAKSHTRLAQLYLAQDDLEAAIRHCGQSTECGSTDSLTYFLAGVIHMHAGNFATAAEVLEYGLEIAEQHDDNSLQAGIRRNELRLALAHCQRFAGRTDAASHTYNICVRENPGSLDAWIGLGQCELERGIIPNAKLAFGRSLKLDSESEAAIAGWQECGVSKELRNLESGIWNLELRNQKSEIRNQKSTTSHSSVVPRIPNSLIP
jgi:tetratricopeptide (TPR) repeat protein